MKSNPAFAFKLPTLGAKNWKVFYEIRGSRFHSNALVSGGNLRIWIGLWLSCHLSLEHTQCSSLLTSLSQLIKSRCKLQSFELSKLITHAALLPFRRAK